jgi:hypothetical protein
MDVSRLRKITPAVEDLSLAIPLQAFTRELFDDLSGSEVYDIECGVAPVAVHTGRLAI